MSNVTNFEAYGRALWRRWVGAARFTIGALQQILLKRTHAARIAFLTAEAAARSPAQPARPPGTGARAPGSLSNMLPAQRSAADGEPRRGAGSGTLVSQSPPGPALPWLDALGSPSSCDPLNNLPEVRQCCGWRSAGPNDWWSMSTVMAWRCMTPSIKAPETLWHVDLLQCKV